MRFRDIFRLEDSKIRAGQHIYNLSFRALMFGLAVVVFGGVSIGLNYFLPVVASELGLGEETQVLLKVGAAVFFVVLVMAAVLLAVGDLLRLVWYYFFGKEEELGED